MKGLLGFLFFMLFLAGFALVMLQGRQLAESNIGGGGAALTGINWRPMVIGADAMPGDSGMLVLFAVDGSINGNGGCNSFFGSLEKTDAGIAIGPLGATRKACSPQVMDREQAFLDALQSTTHFEMGRGRLQLLGADNALLAELTAAESGD